MRNDRRPRELRYRALVDPFPLSTVLLDDISPVALMYVIEQVWPDLDPTDEEINGFLAANPGTVARLVRGHIGRWDAPSFPWFSRPPGSRPIVAAAPATRPPDRALFAIEGILWWRASFGRCFDRSTLGYASRTRRESH